MAEDEKPADARGFAKHLASTEKRMRDKAVSALQTFLSVRSDFSEMDMMKVWRGLFYCFWHSDKAPVQENLAESLACVMHGLSDEACELYLRVFLKTLRREWGGIDKLRLDKFYMLVRRFLQHMLRRVDEEGWAVEAVENFVSILQDSTILVKDNFPAGSLNYHLADIYLPEISTITQSLPFSTLHLLIGPFITAVTCSLDKTYISRIRTGVLDPLLRAGEEGTPALPCADVDHAALAHQLFELGAADATHPPNRRVLYELSETFKKAARERKKAGQGGECERPSKKQRLEPSDEGSDGEGEEGGAEEGERRGPAQGRRPLVRSTVDRPRPSKKAKKKGHLVVGVAENMSEGGNPGANGGNHGEELSGSDGDSDGEGEPRGKKPAAKKGGSGTDTAVKKEKKKKKKKKHGEENRTGTEPAVEGKPATVHGVGDKGAGTAVVAQGPAGQTAAVTGDDVISNLASRFAMAGPGKGVPQGNGQVAKDRKELKQRGGEGAGEANQSKAAHAERGSVCGDQGNGRAPHGPGVGSLKKQKKNKDHDRAGEARGATPAGSKPAGPKGGAATSGGAQATPSPRGAPSTPTVTPASTPAPTSASNAKKRVRFSLKNNLEFAPDSAPLPPDLRTPERSQPHGPALKKVSKWPNSAPPGKGKRKLGREKLANRVATPGAKPSWITFHQHTGGGYATPPAARGVGGMQGMGGSRQRAADFF